MIRTSSGLLMVLVVGFVTPATAAPCFHDGDTVTIRGTASETNFASAAGGAKNLWILSIEQPICVIETLLGESKQDVISQMQIDGLSPPVDTPVELIGKLSTGNDTEFYAEPTIIHVISEHRLAESTPKPASQIGPYNMASPRPQTVVETRPMQPSHTNLLPSDEAIVIKSAQAAMLQYSSARNDMLKGASRPARRQAICEGLSGRQATWWLGTIQKLDTNGDGKGVLSIEIAPSISVTTWNNDLSDIDDRTLIDPQSDLFKTASHLSVGDKVRFNGILFNSDTDCIEEASLTLDGSITEPAFIIRFDFIRPN